MTTLPTFAKCAAVLPGKRTALQELIYYTGACVLEEGEFIDQLTAVIEEERARCDAIVARQGRAAIAGMNAAKEISGHQLQQAAKLRAESNPDALESERAMNATLTEENEALRRERDALRAENEALRARVVGLERVVARHVKWRDKALKYLSMVRDRAPGYRPLIVSFIEASSTKMTESGSCARAALAATKPTPHSGEANEL